MARQTMATKWASFLQSRRKKKKKSEELNQSKSSEAVLYRPKLNISRTHDGTTYIIVNRGLTMNQILYRAFYLRILADSIFTKILARC